MDYKELNSCFKKINSWYNKKTKVLTIKTRPFNTTYIFSEIINKVLNDGGRVLYVWCTNEINYTPKDDKEYCNSLYKEKSKSQFKGSIEFVTINEIVEFNREYDLVIYDDISIFSSVDIIALREAVEELYWRSRKILIYTCEKTFPIGEKYELVYLKLNIPIIEPRFITTRIRLEEDIPLALYEYFKWFKDNNKNVLIIVPNDEKLDKVYSHYYHTLKREDIRLIKYHKGEKINFVEKIITESEDGVFILTNNMGTYINEIDHLSIVVLFADDINYSYKKLLYLCGTIKFDKKCIPEMLLVSKEITSNMEKVKSITRGFNQKLWDKKLLKL